MNLADRLRAVVRSEPAKAGPYDSASHDSDDRRGRLQPAHLDCVADTLGGEWREARGRSASADRPASAGLSGRAATRPRYLVIDREFPPDYALGRVAVADCLPEADGLWPRLGLLMCGAKGSGELRDRLLFVDLETTGLAGGAGTYAFLVGCGWFEGATFRIRQFLLTSFAAERGLLEDVANTMGAAGALVTYNGKTFDLPLIDTRFLFHRMEAPFNSLPHLDMLHPARRLWSSRLGGPQKRTAHPLPGRVAQRPDLGEVGPRQGEGHASCRQTVVEQVVLEHVREGDVPGFEIPSRYFHYVRTGDARPLEGVLEHNRLDLLALSMLTAKAASLLQEGAAGTRTAREAFGLGRLYERGGMIAEARACFARAADIAPAAAFGSSELQRTGQAGASYSEFPDADPMTRAEALRAYGVLCRRARQFEEAVGAWRRILALRDCPAHIAQEATEALAVHHEHRLCDLRAARQFAMQALQFNISTTRVEAVHHRVARIDRKLACPEPGRRACPRAKQKGRSFASPPPLF
jgi:uncharacterized protein